MQRDFFFLKAIMKQKHITHNDVVWGRCFQVFFLSSGVLAFRKVFWIRRISVSSLEQRSEMFALWGFSFRWVGGCRHWFGQHFLLWSFMASHKHTMQLLVPTSSLSWSFWPVCVSTSPVFTRQNPPPPHRAPFCLLMHLSASLCTSLCLQGTPQTSMTTGKTPKHLLPSVISVQTRSLFLS